MSDDNILQVKAEQWDGTGAKTIASVPGIEPGTFRMLYVDFFLTALRRRSAKCVKPLLFVSLSCTLGVVSEFINSEPFR